MYEHKKGRESGEPSIVQHLAPDPEMWERCYLAWQMRQESQRVARH
ncbi:MAG: hypothetical protein K8L99_10840 [Anaerolineae bacterium]|nr:hypothetical protein [Anaerolineae bacterium]